MSGYDASSIEAFEFHGSMLADRVRTSTFQRAILATVKSGQVVVDIGSGTGVLSLFAAMAGAGRVYAIEREPIIEIAREIASRNGLSETVVFLEGRSVDLELPERADVLITETIGNIGFDEGILAWVDDAKRRFLRPGSSILPQRVEVVASLVCMPRDYAAIRRWSEPMADLDFSPLSRLAMNNVHWVDMSPAAIVTPPATVLSADFSNDCAHLSGGFVVKALKDATVYGIGVWFRSLLAAGVEITNAPPNTVPSWEQGFLPLDEPLPVSAGESLSIEVSSSPTGADWTWRVGSGRTHATHQGWLDPREIIERLD